MKLYKLTDSDFCTHKNTKWGENVTHSVTGEVELCKNALHAYTDPRLAAILNPIHSDFINPILWEAEGNVVVRDHTKVGCNRLTTIRQIPLPKISTEQRAKFAITCAKKVCKDKKFNDWADKWLSGEDRTKKSAANAGCVAANACCVAAYADITAAYAANAAANAAYAAYAAAANIYTDIYVAKVASNANINLIKVLDDIIPHC